MRLNLLAQHNEIPIFELHATQLPGIHAMDIQSLEEIVDGFTRYVETQLGGPEGSHNLTHAFEDTIYRLLGKNIYASFIAQYTSGNLSYHKQSLFYIKALLKFKQHLESSEVSAASIISLRDRYIEIKNSLDNSYTIAIYSAFIEYLDSVLLKKPVEYTPKDRIQMSNSLVPAVQEQ